jgi:hypothetical protein
MARSGNAQVGSADERTETEHEKITAPDGIREAGNASVTSTRAP